MHPDTLQRIAAERLADLHRTADAAGRAVVQPERRRRSLRQVLRLPTARAARTS